MWSDWLPEIVENDFKQLSENGISVIRIFPLWPEFQPIVQLYSGEGKEKEIAFSDGPLPPSGAGANGMSEVALQKFEVVTRLLRTLSFLIKTWLPNQPILG
jgi:beta-galactosidase